VERFGRVEKPGAETVTATSHQDQKGDQIHSLGWDRYLRKGFQDAIGFVVLRTSPRYFGHLCTVMRAKKNDKRLVCF
jgi:hypothetical protein